MKPLKPKKEGLQAALTCDERGFIPKAEFSLRPSHTLADLSADYVLYTPAILYLHGQFRDAPLVDFTHMVEPDASFTYLRLPKPVFRGLESRNGDNAWNHVLWVMAKQHWEKFLPWMLSITLMCEASQHVTRIASQSLRVLDVLAASPTFVDVFAFALDTNLAQIALQPNITGLPRLVRQTPDKAVQLFAVALYNGLNPLDIVKAHEEEE